MYEKIIKAFQPIIDLLQGVSFPIAFIVISLGVLTIMIGKKQRGLELVKWATIGYLLMQFLPSLMNILREVGQAMAQ